MQRRAVSQTGRNSCNGGAYRGKRLASPAGQGMNGGRDRDRTCDPFHVNRKNRLFPDVPSDALKCLKVLFYKGYLQQLISLGYPPIVASSGQMIPV
jgi:hypothetical protein